MQKRVERAANAAAGRASFAALAAAWVADETKRKGWSDNYVREVENSVAESPDAEGTGLGSQLIEAFATQLEGEAEHELAGGRFLLRLRFGVDHPHPRGDGAEPAQVVLTSAARPGSRHPHARP